MEYVAYSAALDDALAGVKCWLAISIAMRPPIQPRSGSMMIMSANNKVDVILRICL